MDYPVIYIETEKQLIELVSNLEKLSEFALDLEADVNLHRYGRKLCLAQIWDGNCCWLIDLTVLKLTPLKPLLEDSNVIKVMYSACFDASLLADLAGIELSGLLDLQLCASLLGMGKRSLKFFIHELFDIDLEKDLQTSDWFKRPLSSEQIKYATLDVRYLLEAKDMILPELEQVDLMEEAWDMSHKVEQSRFQKIENPHLRVRNSAHLTPYQKIYLKEFYWVRDKIASELDLPTYKILRSYQLIQLVKNPPSTKEDFAEFKFIESKHLPYLDDFIAARNQAHEQIMQRMSLIEQEIVELRHLLHKHPELPGKENFSVRRLHRFIRNFNPTRKFPSLGRTGIAYEFSGESEGPTILIRTVINGNTGKENSGVAWSSREHKILHSHGNDGHMAILVGLAARLYDSEIKQGKIVLLFQPSSLNGKGAQKILRDKRMKDYNFDYCFSMQNLPGFAPNSIVIPQESFIPASVTLILKLKSNYLTSYYEENFFTLACNKIIYILMQLTEDPSYKSKYSVNYFQLGKQNFEHAPQSAEIRIRLLSSDNEKLDNLITDALAQLQCYCDDHDLQFNHSKIDSFPAVSIDPELSKLITNVADKQNIPVIKSDLSLNFPDDFGYFNQVAPIATWGFGAGLDVPALGSTEYDFPDKLISFAVDFWTMILKELDII